MGMSTNGILAYGYTFGEGTPPVEGFDDDEWRPADDTTERGSDEYYEFDFQEWAVRKLLTAAGQEFGDYVDPEDTKKHWGVWFEAEGYGENPTYMLVAFKEWSYDSATDLGNLAELAHRAVEEKWDDKIAAVLKVLGIEGLTYPEDVYKPVKRTQHPRWMLTSYYG